MGLDMYLEIRKHESVGHWDNDFETKKVNFYPEEFKELQEEIEKVNFLSKDTNYQVGYWRKANEIHKWFVDNCADGEDDCRPVWVSVEKATELCNLCKQVLEDHSKAKELLPTQSGFFFGGTEYDEWYFKDLEYTAHILEKVINFMNSRDMKLGAYYDIYYQASW